MPESQHTQRVAGTLTDRSSAAVGGSSVQLAAANGDRRYLLIQNVAAVVVWVNFGTAAVADQPSIKILADGSLVFEDNFVPTSTVNVIAASGSGNKVVCKEG